MLDRLNINSRDYWQSALGLLSTNFLCESNEQFVMQNGQINNFCIDFNNTYDPDSYRHFSWAADTNCFLNINDSHLDIHRWDKSKVESVKISDIDFETLGKIYKHIGTFTQPKEASIVPIIINIFNRIRNSSYHNDGLASLQTLLYLLATTSDENVNISEYGLDSSIEANLPNSYTQIVEGFHEVTKGKIETSKLILRHASGRLFQEAHYQALLSGQLDIYGMPTPASKLVKNKELVGVHFTPAFITRSIVQESLRSMNLEGLTEIKILDPACGSGEFLKEALRQITEIHPGFTGSIKLYGWDKSKTAITVAKFSLNFEKQQCINQRVDIEIVEKDSLDADWGKFDLILMNPPFVSWEILNTEAQEKVQTSLGNHAVNRPNLASPFFYKALLSLKDNGVLGCVLPFSIFNADSYKSLRSFVLENFTIELLGKLGNLNLFYNAVVDAGIYIATNKKTENASSTIVWADNSLNSTTDALRNLRIYHSNSFIPKISDHFSIYNNTYSKSEFPKLVSYFSNQLERKLHEMTLNGHLVLIKEMFDVKQGTRTGANDLFLIDGYQFDLLDKKEKQLFRPAVSNRAIKNGRISLYKYLWFPYDEQKRLLIETEEDLAAKAPTFYNLIKPSKDKLLGRNNVEKWWALSRVYLWLCKKTPKLVSTEFGKAGYFAFDIGGNYIVERGHAWEFKKSKVNSIDEENLNYAYLSLFCSDFFNDLLGLFSKQIAGGQYYLAGKFVNNIPIPDLTLEDMISVTNELIRYGKIITEGELNRLDEIALNNLVKSIYQM